MNNQNQYVLGLNSPFPWAPGHAYQELELFCYKKFSTTDSRPFLFPWLNSPISCALKARFQPFLSSIGVHIISQPDEIAKAYLNSELIDASLSSIKYVRRCDISLKHYLPHDNKDVYTQVMALIGKDLQPLRASNQAWLTDMMDYMYHYKEYSKFFEDLRSNLRTQVDLENPFIRSIVTKEKKIALINIREHQANASSGMQAEQFEPLVAYLKDLDYTLIDISHDKKSAKVDTFCEKYEITKYWASEFKSALVDIDLFALADCYIGGGGISHLALMLRVPTLLVGTLYPVTVAASFGYQIPCRLISYRTNHVLTLEESFYYLVTRPELNENKYDSWLKKYGPFNMHNCIDEISHYNQIITPSGYCILLSYIDMIQSVQQNQRFSNLSTSPMKDLLGRNYLYLSASRTWHL